MKTDSFRSTPSLWKATVAPEDFASLQEPVRVDVAVIGAGITGVTAAVRLKRAGKTVALIEGGRLGGGETGQTTAHLTELVDTGYVHLVKDFGVEGARRVAASSREAIDWIESQIAELGIDCAFSRVPAYLYTEDQAGVGKLHREYRAARKAGVAAEWIERGSDVGLPFPVRAALKVERQGQFHPLIYLHALAREIPGEGSHVFEGAHVTQIHEGEPCRVEIAGGRRVIANDVFVATNSAISTRFFLHTKVAAYRTYAIGVRLKKARPAHVESSGFPYHDVAGSLAGLFWDTADPYHYNRTARIPKGADHPEDEILIVGGEDHKVGLKDDTEECYRRLEEYARARFPVASVAYRWSGQVMEPADGLPYIGLNPASERIYVATGFSGNGMTFGTIAGLLVSDLILNNERKTENPDARLYCATRIHPRASAIDFIRENVDFPMCMITDRVKKAEALKPLAKGEGQVAQVGGKKCAVFRGEDGELRAFSPVCPHMGCHVHYNSAERTFDCPCHGSRFDGQGQVLNGPSTQGLKPVELPQSAPGAGVDAGKKDARASRAEEPAA